MKSELWSLGCNPPSLQCLCTRMNFSCDQSGFVLWNAYSFEYCVRVVFCCHKLAVPENIDILIWQLVQLQLQLQRFVNEFCRLSVLVKDFYCSFTLSVYLSAERAGAVRSAEKSRLYLYLSALFICHFSLRIPKQTFTPLLLLRISFLPCLWCLTSLYCRLPFPSLSLLPFCCSLLYLKVLCLPLQ